ncbi:MAG: IPT/TIG domain-containing protein [Deltaproteobacteria bacterium]|nr:IPT/TIG domain-containing protein [Deltaproteobacteria bacterium]
MKSRLIVVGVVLLSSSSLGLGAARAQAVPVILEALGRTPVLGIEQTFGNQPWAVGPVAINDAAQIAGWGLEPATLVPQAMFWDPASPTFPAATLLGGLGGASRAWSVGPTGLVVGEVFDAVQGRNRPAVWNPAMGVSPTVLDDLGGGMAYAANRSGAVVGYANDLVVGARPALWMAGRLSDPPTLLGDLGRGGEANGINADGVVVGRVTDPATGFLRVAIWDPAMSLVPVVLPDLGSGASVLDFNDRGQVLGQAHDPGAGVGRGLFWDPAHPAFPAPVVLTDEGGPVPGTVHASDMNGDGVVVGMWVDPACCDRAVSWDPTSAPAGATTVTATRLPGLPDFHSAAYGINDGRSIVGSNGRTWNLAPTTMLDGALAGDNHRGLRINATNAIVGYGFSPVPGGPDQEVALFWALARPTPTLTSITPTSAPAGSPLVLVAIGFGFTHQSEIRLDGAAQPTTFVSATELGASVPAEALVMAGTRSITVHTPAPGGGESDMVPLVVTGPDGGVAVDGGGLARDGGRPSPDGGSPSPDGGTTLPSDAGRDGGSFGRADTGRPIPAPTMRRGSSGGCTTSSAPAGGSVLTPWLLALVVVVLTVRRTRC